MNDIINMTEKLKDEIIKSNEYQEYLKINKVLDNNKDINDLVNKIKRLQKKIVNDEVKSNNTINEEQKLKELFDKLYSYKDYNEYLKISKKLNDLITKIQKNFEKSFNDILV